MWSEKPSDNARHGLEQLLYSLRRELSEAVFSGINPLSLNHQIVSSDVADFEAAIAAKRHADAVKLYRGPFLDGFFLSDADEFERWVEAERSQLATSYRAALCQQADSAINRGDVAVALESRRKLAALDPLDGAAALGLIKVMVAAGEEAAALAHARVHERLLEDELGIGPNPALTAFVEQLRVSRQPQTRVVPVAAERNGQPDAVRPPEVAVIPATVPTLDSRRRLKRVAVAVLIGAPLLTGVIWATRNAAVANSRAAQGTGRIVVLPFRVGSSDSSLLHLREGMVDLVAQKLTSEGGPVVVDPVESVRLSAALAPGTGTIATRDAYTVARTTQAQEVLLGEIVTTPRGSIVLSAAIMSARDQRALSRASVEGSPEALSRLADDLVSDLLARRAGEPESRLSALREAELPAVHAFLAGRAAHRRGDDLAAIAAFDRALTADSTFALAALELASAMGWVFRWTVRLESTISSGVRLGSGVRLAGDEEMWIRAVELAWKKRDRLSAEDVAYLRALRGHNYPQTSSAREVLAEWDAVVRVAPERAEVWTRLGQVLLQQGFALGISDARERAKANFQHAIEIDTAYMRPVGFLLELAATSRDTAEVRRWANLYFSHDSTSPNADYLKWRFATVVDNASALAALRQRFDSLDTHTLERIQWASQVNGTAIADAERALSIMVERAGERRQRWTSLWMAYLLALNAGRPDHALRITEAKLQVEADSATFRWYHLQNAMYWGSDSTAGADAARLLERDAKAAFASGDVKVAPRSPYQWLFLVAQWRLWQGDTTGVVTTIGRLRRAAAEQAEPKAAQEADLLDAMLAATLHRPDARALLERVDSIALQGCCETPHYTGLVIARLRERAGDRAGALRAIRRGRWLFPPENLSTFLSEEGRLAALTGDSAGAIKAYKHYVALRENPEPKMRPQRDSIRAELARLERTVR